MKTTAFCWRTKWPNPCDSFFGQSRVWDEGDKLALVQLNGGGVVRRRSPFMIPAWCVKVAKKTQQPSLERCATKVKFPFSDHKNADEHTIFLTLHYFWPTPKAVRVKDIELTVALVPALHVKPNQALKSNFLYSVEYG